MCFKTVGAGEIPGSCVNLPSSCKNTRWAQATPESQLMNELGLVLFSPATCWPFPSPPAFPDCWRYPGDTQKSFQGRTLPIREKLGWLPVPLTKSRKHKFHKWWGAGRDLRTLLTQSLQTDSPWVMGQTQSDPVWWIILSSSYTHLEIWLKMRFVTSLAIGYSWSLPAETVSSWVSTL